MFGAVDTGKGWHNQVCPRAIGGINTCHKMRHSLSLPTVTYICMRERASTFSSWPDNVLSALSADSNSSKWTRAHLCHWPSVHLGWSLCYATQLIVHQGRSTALLEMCYEHLVLSCNVLLLSQESCFWMEARAWQCVGHGVGVSDHLLGGNDLCCCQPFGICAEELSRNWKLTALHIL